MKTVVITGATSGIGLAVARKLAQHGHNIIGVGRDEARCQSAYEKILAQKPEGKIRFFTADLMQQREVNRLAEEITGYLGTHCDGKLDTLINNAGCVRSWYTTTQEGYEQQFALNHLAPFLLTYRLLPCLQRADGRVIMTGSQSHKGIRIHWNDVMLQKGYNPLTAYKQTKLCNLLFALELNERGIRSYTVDPGLVNTEIGCKQTGRLVDLIWKCRMRHGAPPELPAITYAYLCEQEPAPQGLYYRLFTEERCGKQVNRENAKKLFLLSERLCGIQYEGKHESKEEVK